MTSIWFLKQLIGQWSRQKSGGDSAVRSEFVIAGMIFHPSRCDTRSHDELSGLDQTCCSINSTLGVRCGEAMNRAEAILTMDPQLQDWHRNREGTVYLPASGGDGARVSSMVNRSESSINVVSENKPKIAERLGQNGNVVRTWGSAFPRHGHTTLPADRGHLTRPVHHAERGKPVSFLPEGR